MTCIVSRTGRDDTKKLCLVTKSAPFDRAVEILTMYLGQTGGNIKHGKVPRTGLEREIQAKLEKLGKGGKGGGRGRGCSAASCSGGNMEL